MLKPILDNKGVFRKAMMLARIARVMSADFAFASLIAEAMRAISQACGASLFDRATLKPSLAHSARVTLQDRGVFAAVLNAAGGLPCEAITLFTSGTMALRDPSWEMQSIGRAMLVLGEIAFVATGDPGEELRGARARAYQGEKGDQLRAIIERGKGAFESSLAMIVSASSEVRATHDVARRPQPASQANLFDIA